MKLPGRKIEIEALPNFHDFYTPVQETVIKSNAITAVML